VGRNGGHVAKSLQKLVVLTVCYAVAALATVGAAEAALLTAWSGLEMSARVVLTSGYSMAKTDHL
jgi:hypothetical protein